MALKNRLRSQCSKRFNNVVNDCSSKLEKNNFPSSIGESGVFINKNKVREEFLIKKLTEDNKCFTTHNDHVYSTVRSPKTDGSLKKRISEESDKKQVKEKCFSKNAVMARLNRERKKKYMSSLESENESLRKQNDEINKKMEEQNKKVLAMRREILYLKGLLANSKELGQILRNLKVTTGLPVTSSMILTTETEIQNEILGKSSVPQQGNKNLLEDQPRINSTNSFPIIKTDVNLGSCLNNSINEMADPENHPFDFESDYYDMCTANLNDDESFFDFNNEDLDFEVEECFKSDFLSKNDSQVGICLHVNQKMISVEICSICNGKAGLSLRGLTEEVF